MCGAVQRHYHANECRLLSPLAFRPTQHLAEHSDSPRLSDLVSLDLVQHLAAQNVAESALADTRLGGQKDPSRSAPTNPIMTADGCQVPRQSPAKRTCNERPSKIGWKGCVDAEMESDSDKRFTRCPFIAYQSPINFPGCG